jgi:hypothetical protein
MPSTFAGGDKALKAGGAGENTGPTWQTKPQVLCYSRPNNNMEGSMLRPTLSGLVLLSLFAAAAQAQAPLPALARPRP